MFRTIFAKTPKDYRKLVNYHKNKVVLYEKKINDKMKEKEKELSKHYNRSLENKS